MFEFIWFLLYYRIQVYYYSRRNLLNTRSFFITIGVVFHQLNSMMESLMFARVSTQLFPSLKCDR